MSSNHGETRPHHITNLPMAGLLPKLGIVDVGADDFVESTFPVLLFDEIDESVENDGAFGLEEATAGTQLVEEEQFLILKKGTLQRK